MNQNIFIDIKNIFERIVKQNVSPIQLFDLAKKHFKNFTDELTQNQIQPSEIKKEEKVSLPIEKEKPLEKPKETEKQPVSEDIIKKEETIQKVFDDFQDNLIYAIMFSEVLNPPLSLRKEKEQDELN